MNKLIFSDKQIKEIGERVRKQRLLKNLSQKKLADMLGEKKDVIQRIESGNLKKVNTNRLQSIAYHLDCNDKYFLLESDDSRNPHTKYYYQELPEFQKSVEGYVFAHRQLNNDISYMIQYMHPDFQNQLLNIIHTFITFHKTGVHYPNTTPSDASSVAPSTLDKKIEDNFFNIPKKKHK